MTRPLSDLHGPIRALFSDVDGTMTTGERIEASTYEALERLGDAGIPVIMVTGRPAGWGQAFLKMTSVLAVVSENGGVTFIREGRRQHKLYGVPQASLPEWRRPARVDHPHHECHGALSWRVTAALGSWYNHTGCIAR